MPFDNSGTFNRSRGKTTWQNDRDAGTKILANLHDDNDNDLANGLSDCLTKTGVSRPSVDMNWGAKKITNLGAPTNPTDAATLNTVQNILGWPTSKYIQGTDANGRLNFTGPSGANGISWTDAGMSLLSKPAVAGKSPAAVGFTNSSVGGTPVVFIDAAGRLNLTSGQLNYNLVYENGNWHTPTAGIGAQYSHGGTAFIINANDTATTDADDNTTLRAQFQWTWSSGNSVFYLQKKGSGQTNSIRGYSGTTPTLRWNLELGNATAESGGTTGRTGSNFTLVSYDNSGANPITEFWIDRNTHKATFYGEVVTTNLTTTDAIMTVGPSTSASSFAMQRPITNGSTFIYGGQSTATGAYLELFGEAHLANGRDIILGTETSYRYFFDYSANTHYWANNTPAVMLSLGATGNLTVTGAVLTNNVYNAVNTSSTSLSGGNGISIGAACTFYGAAHASLANQAYYDAVSHTFRDQDATPTYAVISSGGLEVINPGYVKAGQGLYCRAGQVGAYGSNFVNFNWTGSGVDLWVDSVNQGKITTVVSDYRLKQDVAPLESTWDKVMALRPVSYRFIEGDDRERWGFLAHELQEDLTEGAATGVKDIENEFQSPDSMAVIAALTKALQEAMARIEMLEARP